MTSQQREQVLLHTPAQCVVLSLEDCRFSPAMHVTCGQEVFDLGHAVVGQSNLLRGACQHQHVEQRISAGCRADEVLYLRNIRFPPVIV